MISFAFICLVVSFIALLGYFKLADLYNIIDKPNERSSHTEITIRGGGIVFLVSSIVYAIYSGFSMPYFLIGLFLIGTVSFIDDIKTLSSSVRLPLQLIAVALLGLQVIGSQGTILVWGIVLLLSTGIINAYNFMDGVNGITAGYSLVVLLSLYILNTNLHFADQHLIMATLMADVAFSFYNFRTKAKCFAGDVGSVSVAFIVVFLLASLIYQTQNLFYILLLAVYGVDSVLTIIHRIFRKENIFQAHRSHLYQWLVKPGPLTHLQISGAYMLIQSLISFGIILLIEEAFIYQVRFSITVLFCLGLVYILTKRAYIKKYDLV